MPWHRIVGNGWGMMGHPLAWLFGCLFFLLLVALVVWAIVVIARRARHGKPAPAVAAGAPVAPRGEDALEIVRLRYARGEITRDEYMALRDDLAK